MRKKSLALTLMLAFSCILGGNLMGQTYQISNATTGSNTNYPAVSEKSYSVTQQIFSQSEIFSSTNVVDGSTFNYSSGGTITALYFYNLKKTDIELNCDLYYAISNKSEYANTSDWISSNYFTKIYDASTSGNVTFTAESWTSISLTTTISYNGTGNLVIMFVNKGMDSSTQLSFCGWAPSYSNYPSINYSSSSSIDLTALSSTTGIRNYQHNAIRFDITPAEEGCVMPTNFEYSDVTDSEATFTWDAVDGEIDGYEVYVSEDSTTPTEETSGSFTATNSYTKNSLEENTHYYAWVRTKCEEDSYSSWSSAVDFTTDCGIKNLPYTYGFEDASDFDCWTMNNCYDGYTKITSGTTNTGSYKFTFNYSTSHDLQTIITPELNTTSNGVRVEFYIRNQSSTGTPKLKIAYSTSGYDLASFDWINCTEATANSYYYNNYQYFGFDFPYNSIKYIAIQYDRNGSSNNIFLDDIKFSDIPNIDLPYEYGFETDSELNSWIKRDCSPYTNVKNGGHSGSYSFGFARAYTMETQYLITPKLNGTTCGALISFYYTADANCKFQIGYSTTNNFTSSFTFGDEITETTSSYKYYEYYCPANTKYICIKYVATSSSNSSLNIDDVKIVTFDKVSNGVYWDNSSYWTPAGVPSSTDDVYINNSITIEDDVTANAHNITLGPSGSLTIADGGQLICSSPVAMTVEKNIGTSTKGNMWYTIATPVHTGNNGYVTPGNVTNLISGDGLAYDMFYYDEYNTTYSAPYWMHYDDNLNIGQGYLYRNNDKKLSFQGTNNNAASYTCDLDYTAAAGPLAGFNLIGNPYPHNIYKGKGGAIDDSEHLAEGYYTIENGTTWSTKLGYTDPIKPAQGILVQTSEDIELTITNTNATASAEKANNDNIMFTVANGQYEDVTYALFNDGIGLDKISHRDENAPMIYIPQNGKDYAIATMKDNTETFGLNFKAMTTGKYTISAKALGNFSYIHLIDRLTGEDVDLLMEDYSFIGSPADSDARFIVKLTYMPSYSTEGNDNFAYQTGGEILVSGEGELQIFDVTGRKVMTATINGVEAISGLQQGVYIFRVIGENQKTQKIVVR